MDNSKNRTKEVDSCQNMLSKKIKRGIQIPSFVKNKKRVRIIPLIPMVEEIRHSSRKKKQKGNKGGIKSSSKPYECVKKDVLILFGPIDKAVSDSAGFCTVAALLDFTKKNGVR